MKKRTRIILISLFCIGIVFAAVYFIYGNTLVDITSEKSISDNLAADSEYPITILKMAQIGDYFGVLYTDPVDESEGYYHFRYITRAKLYKNRYRNIGGDSRFTENFICTHDANCRNEKRTSAEVFIYGVGGSYGKDNICSVFKHHYEERKRINYNQIGSVEELIEKEKKAQALDSYEKLDEFELPEDTFLVTKTYNWDEKTGDFSIAEGSATEADMLQSDIESQVNEYELWRAGEINLPPE